MGTDQMRNPGSDGCPGVSRYIVQAHTERGKEGYRCHQDITDEYSNHSKA